MSCKLFWEFLNYSVVAEQEWSSKPVIHRRMWPISTANQGLSQRENNKSGLCQTFDGSVIVLNKVQKTDTYHCSAFGTIALPDVTHFEMHSTAGPQRCSSQFMIVIKTALTSLSQEKILSLSLKRRLSWSELAGVRFTASLTAADQARRSWATLIQIDGHSRFQRRSS